MGNKCSCMYYDQEISDLIVPIRKRKTESEKECVLVSLEAQISLQTIARSFLLRKRLNPLLHDYKTKKSLTPLLPYPLYPNSLLTKVNALVLSVEQSLNSIEFSPSQYEYHSAVSLHDNNIYEGE